QLPHQVTACEAARRAAASAEHEDGALEVTHVLELRRVSADVVDGGASPAPGRARAAAGGGHPERGPAGVRLVRARAGCGAEAAVAVLRAHEIRGGAAPHRRVRACGCDGGESPRN